MMNLWKSSKTYHLNMIHLEVKLIQCIENLDLVKHHLWAQRKVESDRKQKSKMSQKCQGLRHADLSIGSCCPISFIAKWLVTSIAIVQDTAHK